MRSPGLNYSTTDAFWTLAQPEPQRGPEWERIDAAGRTLNEFRRTSMIRTNLGLTKIYNRVHDPDEHDADIVRLRELHVELDHAVRARTGGETSPSTTITGRRRTGCGLLCRPGRRTSCSIACWS